MSPADPEHTDSDLPTREGLRSGLRVFERFVLRRILGRGGMGVVWEAHDERLDEPVALKFLAETVRWDPVAIAGLRKETQRARTLTHPHIVRVHDLHEGPDGAAIAMERITGRTLGEWRLSQPGQIAAPESVLAWLPGLCDALDHAHRHAGVIHRDLKPANIMLTEDGRVKVADFGIAGVASDSLVRTSTVWSGGTLPYMSPQQLWGEAPTPSDDLYALGAVLFELLVGEPPFLRGHLFAQIERREPPTVSLARRRACPDAPPLPRVWDHTLARCLAKDPEARPETASAVLRDLTSPASHVSVPRRRRSPLLLGLIAAALAVPVVWVYWPLGDAGTPMPSVSDEVVNGFPGPYLSPRIAGVLGTGLIAHLPLDGDLRSYGTDGHIGSGVMLDWDEDRFGRARGALRFDGAAFMSLPLTAEGARGGKGPWTLAMWIRSERRDGLVALLRGEAAGGAYLSIAVVGGRLTANAGALRSQHIGAVDREELTDGWHHVAATLEAGRVTLWLDGRRIESQPAALPADREAPRVLELGVATPNGGSRWGGRVDDVRLYAMALGADALRSLAHEENPPDPAWVRHPRWEYPWRRTGAPALALTRGSYEETEDLVAAARTEFGAEARVAEWGQLEEAAGPWPQLLVELLGLDDGEAAFVARRGQLRFPSDITRSYHAVRTDGTMARNFLQHARIGPDTLSLGSWYGQILPILVQAPVSAVYRRAPTAPSPAGTRIEGEPGRRTLIAVASLPELTTLPAGVSWTWSAGDNASWQVAWRPAALSTWALEITRGPGTSAPALRAKVEAVTGYGKLDLAVVLREGRLYAAVVDSRQNRWITGTGLRDLEANPQRSHETALRDLARPESLPAEIEWVEIADMRP